MARNDKSIIVSGRQGMQSGKRSPNEWTGAQYGSAYQRLKPTGVSSTATSSDSQLLATTRQRDARPTRKALIHVVFPAIFLRISSGLYAFLQAFDLAYRQRRLLEEQIAHGDIWFSLILKGTLVSCTWI